MGFTFLFVWFLRQGFSTALESVLELALVDQAGLELTSACLCLPRAGIKGMRHHHLALLELFDDIRTALFAFQC